MKLIGIVVGTALLTAAPFSVQCTPSTVGLYVDKADARVVHRRRPYYGYYGVGTAYPRLFAPAPYYGIAPYGSITPYGVAPYPYSVGPPTGAFFMGSK
jgi:hypothetical protein